MRQIQLPALLPSNAKARGSEAVVEVSVPRMEALADHRVA